MYPASARLPGFVEKRLSPAYAACSRPRAAAGTLGARNASDFTHLEQCLRFRGLHSAQPVMHMRARALVISKKSSPSAGSDLRRGILIMSSPLLVSALIDEDAFPPGSPQPSALRFVRPGKDWSPSGRARGSNRPLGSGEPQKRYGSNPGISPG